MSDSFSYQIDKKYIPQEKMQFTVINRRPVFSPEEKETVKAAIEQQLFAVFCKYARPN